MNNKRKFQNKTKVDYYRNNLTDRNRGLRLLDCGLKEKGHNYENVANDEFYNGSDIDFLFNGRTMAVKVNELIADSRSLNLDADVLHTEAECLGYVDLSTALLYVVDTEEAKALYNGTSRYMHKYGYFVPFKNFGSLKIYDIANAEVQHNWPVR